MSRQAGSRLSSQTLYGMRQVIKRRRLWKPLEMMSRQELRSTLVRAIVLEYQNARVKPFPRWGWEKPTSLFVLRRRRIRLAQLFTARYAAVSSSLFARKLPAGKDWPGASNLVTADAYSWVDNVWTHVACTLPHNHRFHPTAHSLRSRAWGKAGR